MQSQSRAEIYIYLISIFYLDFFLSFEPSQECWFWNSRFYEIDMEEKEKKKKDLVFQAALSNCYHVNILCFHYLRSKQKRGLFSYLFLLQLSCPAPNAKEYPPLYCSLIDSFLALIRVELFWLFHEGDIQVSGFGFFNTMFFSRISLLISSRALSWWAKLNDNYNNKSEFMCSQFFHSYLHQKK